MFGDTSCPGINADPKLGPLQDNGGPTQTMALGTGGPAIDQVPAADAGCPASDQRGVLRPFGSGCDIGAYEVAPPAASTVAASAISSSGATAMAIVTPNSGDASVHFDVGTSTAYGSQTAIQHLRGVSPATVSATLAGLSPSTSYHYRVVASSADGTAVGADQTFTTGAAQSSGAPPSVALRATIAALRETNAVFAVAASSTPLSGQTARNHHRGTVFSFRLDRSATVRLAIQATAHGRRVSGSCKPESRKRRHKPRCLRTRTIATLLRTGHLGLNRIAFSGRVRGRPLKPGRYRAVFTAIDAAGTSAPRSLTFAIVAR